MKTSHLDLEAGLVYLELAVSQLKWTECPLLFQRWSFSTCFDPVESWSFTGHNPIPDHLITCPYNQDRFRHSDKFSIIPLNEAPMDIQIRDMLQERLRRRRSLNWGFAVDGRCVIRVCLLLLMLCRTNFGTQLGNLSEYSIVGQPWCNALWLTGLKAPTNKRILLLVGMVPFQGILNGKLCCSRSIYIYAS